jgi:hypothetical protein
LRKVISSIHERDDAEMKPWITEVSYLGLQRIIAQSADVRIVDLAEFLIEKNAITTLRELQSFYKSPWEWENELLRLLGMMAT